MTSGDQLNDREERVLEAVIRAYVETAEPAGSRNVAKRFSLGVSPATIRNTMSDLEEKGFLFHPHTSAGRVPTDRAYRYYVDTLMRPLSLTAAERNRLRKELAEPESAPALERVIRNSAQVLGLLTGELGVAIVPRLDEAVLERLELLAVSSEKVLVVLRLRSGAVRTVFVEVPAVVPPETLASITVVLNEQLAGRSLREVRQTLPARLRDTAPSDLPVATELLNIFVQSADELFDWPEIAGEDVHLGRTSVLANQPEFATGSSLKSLIELTERKDLLAAAVGARERQATVRITIGAEHALPELSNFTLVTSDYRVGNLSGVIGVIGPTRMPYDKVVVMVEAASTLLSGLMGEAGGDPGEGASGAPGLTDMERLRRKLMD